jgi:hypothetical protein
MHRRWCAAALRPERPSHLRRDWSLHTADFCAQNHFIFTVYVSTAAARDGNRETNIIASTDCHTWVERHNANAHFVEMRQVLANIATTPYNSGTNLPEEVQAAWQSCFTHRDVVAPSRPVFIKSRVELMDDVIASFPLEGRRSSSSLPSCVWCPLIDPSLMINHSYDNNIEPKSKQPPPPWRAFIQSIVANPKRILGDAAVREWVSTARSLAASTRDDLTVLDLVKSSNMNLSAVEARRCWERVCGFESTVLNILRALFLCQIAGSSRNHDLPEVMFDWNKLVALTVGRSSGILRPANQGVISLLSTTAQYASCVSDDEDDDRVALRAWFKEHPSQRRSDVLHDLVSNFDDATSFIAV